MLIITQLQGIYVVTTRCYRRKLCHVSLQTEIDSPGGGCISILPRFLLIPDAKRVLEFSNAFELNPYRQTRCLSIHNIIHATYWMRYLALKRRLN